jgi:outer membrane receptor protein involved in Fe transport
MCKTTTLILFGLLISSCVSAQQLTGILLDGKTGEALIGASVVIKGTTTGTMTDVDGKFNLPFTEKPPFTLSFSYVGYETYEVEVAKESDFKKSFNIKLSESENVLKGVEIVDTRIVQKQQESPLTIESMGLQAIKQTASSTFYEGLGSLKGVDMTSASLGFVIINTRGFNSTSPVRSLQLLDGADNQAPGLNFSIGNFAGASEIDIQKVDLIVGASSPLYGPNAFNGVINMKTKDPFYYPGLTVFVKGAERNLFEGAIRWAQSFKNKNGTDKFAYKINFSYLRASDWVADNLSAATNSWQPETNSGGYDAVNRYGDELASQQSNNYDNPSFNRTLPGLKQIFRTGYKEPDLVDYGIRNIKANTALHYRITEKIEARLAYNYGAGTTVYQGDNRYSIKGISFNQIRAEIIQPDKFYIRAYTTMENSGNSYDAVFTALKLQNWAKDDQTWQRDYQRFWGNGAVGVLAPRNRVASLPGFPALNDPRWIQSTASYNEINAEANAVLAQYKDSLDFWHQLARAYADTSVLFGGNARLKPGTSLYDSVFNAIVSRTAFEEGGTKFYDKSKLVHVQGEYKFEPKLKGKEKPFMEILTGASFKMYFPDSRGTVFSDTIVRNYQRDSLNNIVLDANGNQVIIDSFRKVIRNWEVGAYVSINKRIEFGANNEHSIIPTATVRVDKNQNFPVIATPAASVVYSYKNNHTVRVSYSSAIRNPTLQDQYLYYNVGRAILIGNLNGVDSLATVESLREYFNSPTLNDSLIFYNNVPKVRPEKVQSFEVGYKGIIKNKVYLDGSAYISFYRYFLGYQLGAIMQDIAGQKQIRKVYRVAANSPDRIWTYGVSVGINYFFVNNYSLNGNYSWNKLDKRGSTDPIIPAFNTPEHKFNVGISGRDIKLGKARGFAFNINYKWIQGFVFEGSPQFSGSIPTYSLLDAQVSWEVRKIFSTFKIGGSNLVSKKNYQTYGGPAVGRMIYASLLVDIGKEPIDNWYQGVKTGW